MKCILEACSNIEKYHQSVDIDGEACDYCTMNGEEARICVSVDIAGKTQLVNPQVVSE